MAQIFYFSAEASQAKSMVAELAQRTQAHRSFAALIVRNRELDPLVLPEAATKNGQLLVLATIVGLIGGAILGAIMGATELVLGLDLGMGTLIGLIFGGLVGILCAMMAGTRTAKPEIAAAASALEAPQVLVLLTCEDGGDVAFLRRFASEAGIDGAAVC